MDDGKSGGACVNQRQLRDYRPVTLQQNSAVMALFFAAAHGLGPEENAI